MIPRNTEIEYRVRGPAASWQAVYRRDEHGLRGVYRDLSSIELLTIGGSTTDQRLLSEEHTWQGVMRRAFAAGGRHITIVNAGIDGQSTIGHLLAFDEWFRYLPAMRAKWILAYIGINDRVVGSASRYDDLVAVDGGVKAAIVRNSAVYRLFRTVRSMILAEAYELNHRFPPGASGWNAISSRPPPLPPGQADGLRAYGDRIVALAGRIRRFGGKPIFVTQPLATFRLRHGSVYVREGVDSGVYYTMRRFNDRLMETCRAVRAICLDLAGEVEFGDGDFYDGLHTTPAGARRIGRYLHRRLRGVL